MSVLISCVSVCHMYTWCLHRSDKGNGFPGTEVGWLIAEDLFSIVALFFKKIVLERIVLDVALDLRKFQNNSITKAGKYP